MRHDLDWPRRLVAATRRQDAAVLRKYGPLHAPGEASAALLRALKRRWPTDTFDELNIATAAPYEPVLRDTVEGVIGRAGIVGRPPRLDRDNERDLWRWFLGIAEIEIDGLRLHRDAIGWCRVQGWLQ
jgi:hypothetical protein